MCLQKCYQHLSLCVHKSYEMHRENYSSHGLFFACDTRPCFCEECSKLSLLTCALHHKANSRVWGVHSFPAPVGKECTTLYYIILPPPPHSYNHHCHIHIHLPPPPPPKNNTTQCKLLERKFGICTSGWKEKHHRRKLQWVKPSRVQLESLCQQSREKHHHHT